MFPADPANPGAANTFAVRLDAGDNGTPTGTQKLQYSLNITLNAGDQVNFSLNAWRESGNRTIFAQLTGPSTIDLFSGGSQSVTGSAVYSGPQQTITEAGNYTFTLWADQSDSSANHIWVDNLNLNVVPEPTITLLGSLGILTLMRRRR